MQEFFPLLGNFPEEEEEEKEEKEEDWRKIWDFFNALEAFLGFFSPPFPHSTLVCFFFPQKNPSLLRESPKKISCKYFYRLVLIV